MRALRKWCKGSISKCAVGVLGLTVINLPLLRILWRIYVQIFNVSIPRYLFSWRTMVYLIPTLVTVNLLQLIIQPDADEKKPSKGRPMLETALIAIAACVLTIIPIDSPRVECVLLWLACTLIFFLMWYAIFEIIDNRLFKRLSTGEETEQ